MRLLPVARTLLAMILYYVGKALAACERSFTQPIGKVVQSEWMVSLCGGKCQHIY
jgi:hypothetical protein